jgi:2-oxo-4-hydroxy-4-carboxy-5-ureidoimidazoline decarboxylase
MTLAEHLNRSDETELAKALARCCAALAWVAEMIAIRPFASDEGVLQAAADVWWRLKHDDWLEAFAAHPQIGNIETLREKFADTRAWAGGEQAGVAKASEATLERLAELNREYVARFGYIFIVFATGKSADEMLAILENRLPNEPEVELLIAAGEQLKITQLRLRKLVA